MQRLRTELFALKMALRMAHQYLFDPSLRAVSSIRQFFTMFGQIAYEAVTNNGKTVEEVAVEALGKDRNALSGKVAIITGANSGLGLQNARVLMHYGCTVIWAVRNLEKAQKALDKLDSGEGTHTCEDGHVHRCCGKTTGKAILLQVDISDLTTVKPFVTDFLKLGLPLHYLILNAGIMAPPQWEPSKQGYESMFATNNLGHFLMSELLLPKIEETAKTATEARIVILSSAACTMCTSIDLSKCPVPKEEYHELGTYAVTKAIDAFHARYLQEKYRGANIYACAVHPGVIETGLLAKNEGMGTLFYKSLSFAPFRKSIPQGAATTMFCTVSPDVPKHAGDGYFFYFNRGPQRVLGVAAPGWADHLVHACEERQLELVKPYM